MVNRPWTRRLSSGTSAAGAPLHQWEHGGIRAEIMLSTDMSLAFVIAGAELGERCGSRRSNGRRLLEMGAGKGADNGKRSAQPCTSATTRTIVDEFGAPDTGLDAWADEFSLAFTKLVELGHGPANPLGSLGVAHFLKASSLQHPIFELFQQAPVADSSDSTTGSLGSFKYVLGAVGGVALAVAAAIGVAMVRKHRRQSRRLSAPTSKPIVPPLARVNVPIAWAEDSETSPESARSAVAPGNSLPSHVAASSSDASFTIPETYVHPRLGAMDVYLEPWNIEDTDPASTARQSQD